MEVEEGYSKALKSEGGGGVGGVCQMLPFSTSKQPTVVSCCSASAYWTATGSLSALVGKSLHCLSVHALPLHSQYRKAGAELLVFSPPDSLGNNELKPPC